MRIYGFERRFTTCAECGKIMYVPDKSYWAYTRAHSNGKKYYCSWSCYRKEEIRKGIDRNGKQKKIKE